MAFQRAVEQASYRRSPSPRSVSRSKFYELPTHSQKQSFIEAPRKNGPSTLALTQQVKTLTHKLEQTEMKRFRLEAELDKERSRFGQVVLSEAAPTTQPGEQLPIHAPSLQEAPDRADNGEVAEFWRTKAQWAVKQLEVERVLHQRELERVKAQQKDQEQLEESTE